MDSIEKKITYLLLILAIIEGIFLAVSITGTPCHVDEAWMGEQSYHEAHDGVARQELLPGMFRFEERSVNRHKLFVFFGDLTTRVSGFSLYHLRFVSVLAGIALFWMLFLFLNGRYERHHILFLLTVVILLSCPLFFRYMKIYRPECLLAAFGFLSFLLLRRAVDNKSGSLAALSGAAAGLAVLTHLNGVIFVAAGAITFLIARQKKYSLFFFAAAALVSSLYLYDVIGNYDLFKTQFFNDFTVEIKQPGFFAPVVNILQEHKRYFRTPEVIGISVLLLLSLTVFLKERMPGNGILFWYTGLLAIFLGLVSKSLTAKYAFPLLPFFALITACAVVKTVKGETRISSSKIYRGLLAVFLVFFVSYGLYYSFTAAFLNRVDTPRENAAFAQMMKPDSKVLAPGKFIFNEIGRFSITDLFVPKYLATVRTKGEFNLTSLCEYAMAHNIDYIVVDEEYRKMGDIDPGRVIPSVWGYSVKNVFENGAVLLERYREEKQGF